MSLNPVPAWFLHYAEEKQLQKSLRVLNLMRGNGRANTNLFTLVTSDGTQGNYMRLSRGGLVGYQEKVLISCSGQLSTGNRFSRGVVIAPCLAEFKKYLDNALRHRVTLEVSCARPGVGSLILMAAFHQESIFYEKRK